MERVHQENYRILYLLLRTLRAFRKQDDDKAKNAVKKAGEEYIRKTKVKAP